MISDVAGAREVSSASGKRKTYAAPYSSDNATLLSLAVGDVTGDSYHDILVGAGDASPGGSSKAGSTYLIYGKAPGTMPGNFDNGAGNQGVYFTRFDGGTAGDWAGSAVQVLDLDKDGTGDIVIAAPAASPGSVSKAGSVYVLWGKSGWNGTTTYSLGNIQ